MTGFEAYLLARAYTNKAIEGGGSLKGAACQIKSIEPITGGNRVTFEWEDNQGVVSTDTMDVMNGQNGSNGTDGVGITSITYKSEDAQGNYIYTVALSDSTSYDITCPKGAKGDTGATGADGQDGADGVGIASITKTGTSGLVDTYTITYTNGTTSTFTVTNGSGADLTAGQYIEIDNDTISVKRDISKTAQQIEYNYTIPSDYTLRVKKYLNGDLVDTTDYQFNSVVEPINLDSIMEVSKKAGGGFYWVVKNLIASTTQAADYSVELYAFQTSTNYTQNFVATIDADKKLIIQSELDAALADKVDKVAGKGLSKNDYTDADKAKVDASLNVFTGTQAEWAALSTAEKKTYQRADFTDDYDNTAIGDLTALHTSAKSSIVNAINEVADGKQNSTDNNLQTTSKTIVGGINEVKSGLTIQVGNITPSASVTNDTEDYPIIRRMGNVVTVFVSLVINDTIPAWTSIADLSTGFRPIHTTMAVGWLSGTSEPCLVRIGAEGSIMFSKAVSTGKAQFSVSYIVN